MSTAPFKFNEQDSALLEDVQHACFLFFWNEVGQPSGLVKDRLKAPVGSVAATGFQLSSLPIGVEHGWITREQGAKRAESVLRALIERKDNKRLGMYLHFPDHNTGGRSNHGYEDLVSTVDTALLIAGAIPVAEYFGGDIAVLVERLIAEADWKAFATAPGGFLSMGWTPDDPTRMDGPGKFHPAKWDVAADEERLIYFLAVGSPVAEHALPPSSYFKLKRIVKGEPGMMPYVVSWPGALFTYLFSHCWIDYATLGPDNPGQFGVGGPRVDWWENSRRAVLTHRRRCLAQGKRLSTMRGEIWGQSACAGRDGYLVPMVQPNMAGEDRWGEGTVAPYAAGTSIMFAPRESVAALRAFRGLNDQQGKPLVWRDPATGGYGLADAFNLDQGYVSDDYIGIDHGPMLLGIENARTGLIWRLFMGHRTVRAAVSRLDLGSDKPK
ncbi:MAG: hypothetical protein GY842_08975 [bacterium]|nr:hypothetical protein [bacterium]